MLEQHAFLQRNAARIRAQAVRTLVEVDPFWPSGLRESVRILEWTRVFADRAALTSASMNARP
jgi:hypothetical protein